MKQQNLSYERIRRVVHQSDRYRIETVIGERGMALVCRGWDRKLEAWRAFKALLPEFTVRAALRERFVSEALALSKLEHPNIVRVYDVVPDGEVPYMVLELCEGGSVAEWLRHHGPMPSRMAVDVILQACEGVKAVHQRRIVHRDLKPDNLLLSGDGRVQVSDFGIANYGPKPRRSSNATGTYGYMAPEQSANAEGAGVQVDVFALGATLVACLTARDPDDLSRAEHEPERLADVPPLLRVVVAKAVRYSVADRFSTVEAFAQALAAVRAALPPLPTSAPPLVSGFYERPPPLDLRTPLPSVRNEGEVIGADIPVATATPVPTRRTATPAPEAMRIEEPAVVEEVRDTLIAAMLAVWDGIKAPLTVIGGPLTIILLILLGVGAIGAAEINKAAAAAREAESAFTGLVLSEARLIDDLVALGSDETALLGLQSEVSAKSGKAKRVAALRYLSMLEQEYQRGRGNPPPEARHNLTTAAERLQRLMEHRDVLTARLVDWERSVDGQRASLAISLGMAEPPP